MLIWGGEMDGFSVDTGGRYDPQTDMAPLSMMMRAPTVLVVPPNSPYKTLAELISAAKAQPGKLNYAAGSAGYQLMSEGLNRSEERRVGKECRL